MGPITKSTIRTSFVFVVRLLIQASTLLLVARLLGTHDYGLFAGVAALAVLIGTFSTFGTHLVLLGEVSKNQAECSHILSYAVPTTLITGSLLFFFYIFISFLFFYDFSPSLIVIVCIGLTEILLLPLFGLSTIEELGLGKTAQSQLLTIFPLGLRTLSAVLVLFISPLEPLILFSWLYMISALFALFCRKIYKPNAWLSPIQWRFANRRELKDSAGYAALALTAAGPSEVDKMLAVKLLPLGLGGIYVVASRAMGAVSLPVIALLLSAFPRLFRSYHGLDSQSSRLNYWIIFSVFIYSILAAYILWSITQWIENLFGPEYKGLAEILNWLCLVMPIILIRITLTNILMSMHKTWLRVGIELSGMLILVIGAIILYRWFDILGIVLASGISELGMVIASFMGVFYKRKKN